MSQWIWKLITLTRRAKKHRSKAELWVTRLRRSGALYTCSVYHEQMQLDCERFHICSLGFNTTLSFCPWISSKKSSLNENVSSYHILNVWVRQSEASHVRTLSPCPRCSVLTSDRVFQLAFPPPLPPFISVRDCPSMAWPSLSYLSNGANTTTKLFPRLIVWSFKCQKMV